MMFPNVYSEIILSYINILHEAVKTQMEKLSH